MARKKNRLPMANPRRGNFWTINLGHMITLVAYLLTGAYYVGHFRSENSSIKTKLSTIEQDVTRIDREGSMYLKGLEHSNGRELETHDKRLANLEELIPKIANMEGTVNGIKNDFTYLKDYILKQQK
jgi:hypothetical protein